MARLLVHVEGTTEEEFVKKVLQPYLFANGFYDVRARLLGNRSERTFKGGIRKWPSVKREIAKHLNYDPSCIVTTMVDFYALPKEKDGAWPGRSESQFLSHAQKAPSVEKAMFNDLQQVFNGNLSSKRFVPFVVMHEFEALLFSDCPTFSQALGHPHFERQFSTIRAAFTNPEEINDSPQTAPSKRIQEIFAGYKKPLHGPLAAAEIGLDRIRQQCPHFNNWMNRLLSCLH